MKAVFYLLSSYFVLFSSAVEFNSSDGEFYLKSAENEVVLPSNFWNVSEANVSSVLDVYHKIADGTVTFTNETDLFEGNMLSFDIFANSTITEGIDSDGCDALLRKDLENQCDEEYDRLNTDAHEVVDPMEQAEALCCAVEDFEKCNLGALDKANCGKYKATTRENMKAARLFLTVITNVSCSKFRGLCAPSSSAPALSAYNVGFAAALTSLSIFL